MRHRRPIGILDSGVGGLSVLRELRRTLPGEDFIYVADSAGCPYGPKPQDEIRRRVLTIADLFLERQAKAIVLACNSATIVAIETLRAHTTTPVAGMEPAVKPAATLTRTGVVAVLATEASIAGEKFHRLVNTHAGPKGVRVITRPCPEFVALVEAGITEGPSVQQALDQSLPPLLDAGVDTLVLGCTHFPFLRPAIENFAGPHITVLDTGEAVARRVKQLLGNDLAGPSETPPQLRLLTTGDPARVDRLAATLCPELPGRWSGISPP